MARFYAIRVRLGKMKLSDVPAKCLDEVKAILAAN